MKVFESELYKKDIENVVKQILHWKKLEGKTVLITGGSGLIGSFLTDVLMMANKQHELNCKVVVVGRNIQKAKERFYYCWDDKCFQFVIMDILQKIDSDMLDEVSYIIHLASNTHPIAYATDPIGTISMNILGTYNLLEFAIEKKIQRFVFASSNEIYGENRGDTEFFDEKYCGYIDCNTLRAGYPESKRCGEALCQAYLAQKGIDIVIPRFTRTYGPTMLMDDSKVLSQFIKNSLNGENIVLKSDGMQFYSYTYVADAVSGLLTVMLLGKSGECYNIAYKKSDIRLKDLAAMIAEKTDTEVVFEIPDEVERKGYSTATKARLDASKLMKLGWKPVYDMETGIENTLSILRRNSNKF